MKKITFLLPALAEISRPGYRPIKYSLFPPLGLAILASFLPDDFEAKIIDEHVETIPDDDTPDIVAIEVYITNAYRAYELAKRYKAKGATVLMGGLHVTSMPEEARRYADVIFTGPAEHSFPQFLDDYRRGQVKPAYDSGTRSLKNLPLPRRDLFQRHLYLVPNSIVASRGCPHHCDFCYKDAFFKEGKSFYLQTVERTLREIDSLPGRQLYFLDDHLFAAPRFIETVFEEITGQRKYFQGAATVESILRGSTIEKAARAGMRSIFIGFETLQTEGLAASHKNHNLKISYEQAIRRCHDNGIMINGSFVFGFDGDTTDTMRHTVDWALQNGIATATFHILTPYPGTRLFEQFRRDNRLLHTRWNEYDTRTVVFRPQGLTVDELQDGYRRAYRDFYRWTSIFPSAAVNKKLRLKLKQLLYTIGWKKSDWLWNLVIRLKRVYAMEKVLGWLLGS